MDNQVYVHEWKFRCDICDLPCSSKRGIVIHKTKSHKPEETQNFTGRLADEAVRFCKVVEQQKERPVVKCCGQPLENTYKFKYLGSTFAADADQMHDVKSRIAMVFTRCGKLRHVLDASTLSIPLKLRLYQAAVCSILTYYDCEKWRLTPEVMKKVNGANSKMLAGKSIPQEARRAMCSFNLVSCILHPQAQIQVARSHS